MLRRFLKAAEHILNLMNMFKDKKTRNDIILGLAVIVLAAGVWLASELLKEEGSFAVVTVNGTETARYSLSEDAEIRLESENGGYNILVIKDGKADVKVLESVDKWYGVTYKEDKPAVVNAFKEFKEKGIYPKNF